MLSKRTLVGIGAGSAITAVGIISMILSLGVQVSQIDETLEVGESTRYKFNALENYNESINITGSSFHLLIETPDDSADSLQVDKEFKNNASFDWTSQRDGTHRISVKNTGESEVSVQGRLEHASDPVLFAYHMLVIIAGMVIIGISAGFTVRKPKGF